MSFEKDQDEFALPLGNNKDQRSVNFLPKYFRTDTNKKFLNSTIDQMITPGVVEKVDAFAGRRYSRANRSSDSYLKDVSIERENYQFEPWAVYKDDLDNVEFLKDYNDYLGIIKNFRGSVSNQSLLNSQEFYAWNPHIDWDKFTNFREYYWLPFGPQPVGIAGQSRDIVSTYTVTVVEDLGAVSYVFTPDAETRNPSITLYRGQTYRFEINTPGYPIAIASDRTFTDRDPTLGIDITQTSVLYQQGVSSPGDFVEQGVIEFTVPETAPETLYYVNDTNPNISGLFNILDITENTEINVELEILGKKTYKTSNGFELSNGMKVFFQGQVLPEKYQYGFWYAEGVGNSIQLINEQDLETPFAFTADADLLFDNSAWDTGPFEQAADIANKKDYIVINRSSADRNPWSRYNRWFHRDVISKSSEINGQPENLDQDSRAKRPIIEFEAGLKLYNHGTRAKPNVDLVDDFTRDIFSVVEGSIGYNVDGVDLFDGMRILFTADTDVLVNGRIYEVQFVNHLGRRQIALVETEDSMPQIDDTVLVLNGVNNRGKMFYYNGIEWKKSQEKTQVNQSPLFDLYDHNGNSFADTIEYPSSTFAGNKLFSYKLGFGPTDSELGFPLNYRNIANLGDIVFDFDLLSDTFEYQNLDQSVDIKSTDIGYLKRYNYRGNDFEYTNAWQRANINSRQAVLRQYTVLDNQQFPVDVFDRSADLEDLQVVVFLNSSRQTANVDYRFENINNFKTVIFDKSLNHNDTVLLKCYSSSDKNKNGFYEIPSNLERNPLNDNVTSFTLGEVNDHVDSIVENLSDFKGDSLGKNNLRDLGSIAQYGRKFVQHSGPLNLALFHLTDKKSNIIKAVKFARNEYARFKRQFLTEAENLDIDAPIRDQVDLILSRINRDRVKDQPFYFSDMLGHSAAVKNTFVAAELSSNFIPLARSFDLKTVTERAVYVYVNDQLLIHGNDYDFEDGFVIINKSLLDTDRIDVYEYESTNGSFIPQTPSKLGLYPAYVPQIYVDDTYVTAKKIIQGHDGSLILAFDDYRDDLILELETRIYNNIKTQHKDQILDIFDFTQGKYRNTGVSVDKINDIMLSDFSQWLSQVGSPDFTDTSFWNKDDAFTYNYDSMTDQTNMPLNGYWRNIYKFYYDTDRPHSHPWEMLGFSIKPSWWESVYGPAPYTKNNTILWQDLSEGLVREPNKLPVRKNKFARPDLLNIIPVDDQGNLVDPLQTGIARNFVLTKTKSNFKFGDHAPVETAWRRSSEYPFSLITAWILTQPAKIFGLGFDVSRIHRDLTGNIVYSETEKRIRLQDLKFPCVCASEDFMLTSGLVNYVSNYISGYRITNQAAFGYSQYQKILKGLDNQLGIKVGGFADKQKLKLVLDSRTPLNKGNVFVPEKNYQMIFNISSPQDTAVFSGIIIEKTNTGFVLRGYDREDPVFLYNDYLERSADPVLTIGGISESFVKWSTDQEYAIGTIVEYQNSFYRSKITHRSSSVFESEKFIKLPELPVIGGATAIVRTQFSNEIKRLPYGSSLTSIQDVVDFMTGYDVYLRQQGFKFDFFNRETEALEDMQLCIKEFLFWTTQNWDTGTVLTVSPVANKVEFERDYFVVDDVFDSFYDYNLISSDGKKISQEFSNIFRDSSNQFGVRPIGIREGIYLVKLPLVQKEHVVLIDNETEFNDIIYDKTTGYRQERIRLVGYRTADWNGGLNIPGFFYDDAKVTLWQPWRDYIIGDLVKYKEFFYSSNQKHTSTETFDANKWNILTDQPVAQLYTNWDYRVNQFADFYDLDSDNFDAEQQKLAQHLIGYQKRDYLSNIIVDDVSQYKFYQGYIQDKGTLNSLTKLFDALSSSDKDSLEFYEEWAIRLAQYGAANNIKEVEYVLDESKFRMEPQPVELTPFVDNQRLDLVYQIPKFETYVKFDDYDHKPFKTITDTNVFSKDSGYVRDQDVDILVETQDAIIDLDITTVPVGSNIWVLNHENSWTVYRHSRTDLKIIDIQDNTTEFTAVFDSYVDLAVGEIIGIYGLDEILNGFYKVDRTDINTATFLKSAPLIAFDEINDSTVKSVTKMVKRRFANVNELNNAFYQFKDSRNERIWLDRYENDAWAVLSNENIFSLQQEILNPLTSNTDFAVSYAVNQYNTIMAIGAPGETSSIPNAGIGFVRIYARPSERSKWTPVQILGEGDTTGSFGQSVAVSNDGVYIAVSVPLSNKVSIYKKSDTGIYRLFSDLMDPENSGSFGLRIMFRNTNSTVRLFVNAPDSSHGVIYVYDLINNVWQLVSRIDDIDSSAGYFEKIGSIYDVNSLGDVLITTTSDGPNDSTLQKNVMIYRSDSNNNWILDQRIDYFDTLESFGASIAVNDLGDKIAIGSPKNDSRGTDNGCVYIFKQVNGVFELDQTLFGSAAEYNEMFGDFVDFSQNKLIVASKNGDLSVLLSFDEDTTFFDNNTTNIVDKSKNVGKVYVYQEINGSYIYAEDLNKIDEDLSVFEKIRFNSINNLLILDNHIYLGLPNALNNNNTIGSIIDCRSDFGENSWNVISKQSGKVDINQFKKCFIYNKKQNRILLDLDIVDARQGKIPAPAEQEISFKTFYDPAIYSSNVDNQSNVVVDVENAWSKENVGKLWWNLSTSSWYNPYQSGTLYRSSKWNELIPGSTVQICEWVETDLLPREWRIQADTPEGITKRISGQPLYENDVYSVRKIFDSLSNRFVEKYYYWVVNSTVAPQSPLRLRSALEVAQLIAAPESLGYRFVAPLGENSFALHNVKNLIQDQDSVLHFSLIDDITNQNNVHNEYQLLTEGLESSQLNPVVEQKWIDSLVGYDQNKKPVPDADLSVKERYGILNVPRQSMFVNRIEAAKQFVERANSILIKAQITDSVDFSKLESKDPIPEENFGLYDTKVDTRSQLRFVSVAKTETAALEPVITDGKITAVNIINPGRGYKTVPSVTINTLTGQGAVFDIEIDSVGKIVKVDVNKSGTDYATSDTVSVRKFSVLIQNDETQQGKWSIAEWDKTAQQWSTVLNQSFDTAAYWHYVDWFADGYTNQSLIDYTVNQTYELFALNDNIGDVVKVNTVGSGGWLLLEKINDMQTEDYSLNYRVVGRANGTIQINSSIYDYSFKVSGFDVALFDSAVYDKEPIQEFRNIIDALRDDILVSERAVEWNRLFFASVRYALSEQPFVDWIFKTSFVRAVHNLGELQQKVTYQNDNLESYEAYVNEVKPYSAKVREYISDYSAVDYTQSMITDFDLPPSYNPDTKIIEPSDAVYNNGEILNVKTRYQNFPFRNWLDNVGFDLTNIDIIDGGSGYLTTPIVTVSGNNGATAKAYLAQGSVTAIEIQNPGGKFLEKPDIIIQGSISENGTPARAIAVLGNSLVRTPHIALKFDRVGADGLFDSLATVQQFTGNGAQDTFVLKWPMDVNSETYKIYLDTVLQLSSEVSVGNIKDTSKGFDRQLGFVKFQQAPAIDSAITVEYNKSVEMLTAADRINFFYQPTEGMPGKDLAQLMQGVDYHGVNVTSYGFGNDQGWDVSGWGGSWDTFNVDQDGNFIPPDESFDTALAGGTFDVLSAAGTQPGEIIVDGDGFVTATTSKGPEELLPGQIGDVLDLKVYHRSSPGAGIITASNYMLNGIDTEYDLSTLPITNSSIVVKINNVMLNTTDYHIDYNNKTLTLQSAGNQGDRLNIVVIGVNGIDIIDSESFVHDGSTLTVSTGVNQQDDISVLVTANGNVLRQNVDYSVVYSDTVQLVFESSAIAQDDVIQYSIYNGLIQSYSQITIDNTFVSNGINNYHTFDQVDNPVPFNKQPISHSLLIKKSNTILNPGYSVRYIATANRDYDIEKWQFNGDATTIRASEILVFADGVYVDPEYFVFDSAGSFIRLLRSDIAPAGSELEIYVLTDADYYSLDTEISLDTDLSNILSNGDTVTFRSSDSTQLTFEISEIQGNQITLKSFSKSIRELHLVNTVFNVNDAVDVNVTSVSYVPGTGITFKTAPLAGEPVLIYQFSNHDVNDFARRSYDVINNIQLSLNSADYVARNLLAEGIVNLSSPSVSSSYVWIAKNGTLLSPNVDYVLENSSRIKLAVRPVETDNYDILQFRNTTLSMPKFGYRLFKDIIGRTHYKRLNQDNSYLLAVDLSYQDDQIHLEDAQQIEIPDKSKNIPGVLFIAGERIEYFEINGNVLSQLRRGTLGTSIGAVYHAGTRAYGQGRSETVRYRDQVITKKETADGVTHQFDLGFDISDLFDNYVNFTGRSDIEHIDFFEVFVGGQRLRKKSLNLFDPDVDQDSVEADIVLEPEYQIDTTNNKIILAQIPAQGVNVEIVRKVGKIWNDPGKSLAESQNEISKFLRSATIQLP
jgi:hypothetical protein